MSDRDTREVLKAVAKHLEYSFEEIGWNFNGLTVKEQEIFKNPKRFAAVKDFVKSITEKGMI